jgi:hypothetical protein
MSLFRLRTRRPRHARRRPLPKTAVGVLTLATVIAGLLVAKPAFAAGPLSNVSFSGSPQSARATAATWTVDFTTSSTGALDKTSSIVVTFDQAFTVPASPGVTLGVGFSACTATTVVSGRVVTVSTKGGQCSLPASTHASLTIGGITNPAAGTYSMTVSTSADTTSVTTPVTISAGVATKLAFTTQPSSSSTSSTTFAAQPVVAVQDADGATVTTNSSSVSLAITAPNGATLSCTTNPVTTSGGVASFSGCKIDKAGSNYTLTASASGLTAGTSASFNITVGSPSKVAFTTAPPSTGTAGSALATFAVSIQDAQANTIASGAGATDAVTLSIATGPVGGGFNSVPSTYTNVVASAGVAMFSGIVFNTAGTYTLIATDTSRALTTATSSAIIISATTATKLAFVQGPSDVDPGGAMMPAVTVQVQDQFGNRVSSSGTSIMLTPSAGVIASGATATTTSGLATFSGVTISTVAFGLTLTASASGLTSTPASTSFNVAWHVSNGAQLTDAAVSDGLGSGVRQVDYYYCAGYTGTCTQGTFVGSSTTPAGNYAVTWNDQPVNGGYRVVAVSTDNVNNASSASAAFPVTVAN